MKKKYLDCLLVVGIIMLNTFNMQSLVKNNMERQIIVGRGLTFNTPNIRLKEQVQEEKMEEEITEEIIYIEPEASAPDYYLANEVINYALSFVGNPYVYGGNSLTEGTDCSGFTSLIFANYGIYLPRTAYSQGYVGGYVSINNIEIGDLVLYGYDGMISHVALYIGNNQVVHALNSDVGIVVTNYQIMPIITVRRVL